MKILGYTIALGKNKTAVATNPPSKRSSRTVLKKQPRRNVSFQITDIKSAEDLANNIDAPDRGKLLKIFDYIKKDGHLLSQMRNAKFEVLSEPWQIYSDDKVDETTTRLLQKRWMNKAIEFVLDAEFYGYTVVEVDDINPKEGSIGYLICFPREHISIEKQRILIEANANGAYIDYADIIDDLDLVEFFTNREDKGIFLECAYNVLWKFYSRSDWSRANEKVGMPIVSIEANTNNDEELDRLEGVAANFGSDGYIVTQQGDKVTLIERKNENFHLTFKDKAAMCNEEVSKIINGQTGTGDVKAFVGTAEVHERTMATFTAARLQFIADEINEKWFPFLIKKGFALEGKKFDYPELIRTRERKLNPAPIAALATEPPVPPTPPKSNPKKK